MHFGRAARAGDKNCLETVFIHRFADRGGTTNVFVMRETGKHNVGYLVHNSEDE